MNEPTKAAGGAVGENRKEVKQSCLEKIEACLTPKTNFTVGFDAMRKFYGPYKDAVKADAELMDSLADRYCRQQMCSGVRTPEGKRDLYRNGTKDEFIRPSKTRDIGGVTRVRDDLRDAAEATSQQASNINKYVKKLSSEAAADVQTTLRMGDGTDGAM